MKSQKIRRRPESCHAYHPHVSHPIHTDHERVRIYRPIIYSGRSGFLHDWHRFAENYRRLANKWFSDSCIYVFPKHKQVQITILLYCVLAGKCQGLWWSMQYSSISHTVLHMSGYLIGPPLNNKTSFCHGRCPTVDPRHTKQDTFDYQLWISKMRNSTNNRFT